MHTGIRILLLVLICDPDHLCFRRTIYDNINGPAGTIYVVIVGLAGPLMYPDQIFRYRPLKISMCAQPSVHVMHTHVYLCVANLHIAFFAAHM